MVQCFAGRGATVVGMVKQALVHTGVGLEVQYLEVQYKGMEGWRSEMAVVCPECDNPLIIDADEVEEGETVQCDECGIDLEVVSVDPLELAAVDDAGYDDEDDGHLNEDEDE